MGEQYVQLSLEGPAPHVQIGSVRNFDHLAGRIFMEVGPNWVIPVYLDQKPQCVCLGGRMVNLQFEDSLRVVLIDGLAHPVNFDGHLTEVFVDGYQMFIRFSALPQGVKPGTVFQPIIQNPVAPSLGALPKTDASHGLPVDVKELLSRLIQKGLLPTVSDTSSESLSESEEKACIGKNIFIKHSSNQWSITYASL